MTVDYEKQNDEVVIYLQGELGNFEARQAMAEIEIILALYKKEDIILDMAKVTFMDSSGIAIIMKIFKKSKDKRNFIVRQAPNLAMKIFKASGVVKFINFV